MARCVGAAAILPESDRKDLAIQALARSATISDLSVRHSVSRKFVYQQAHKAGAALDKVFLSSWLRVSGTAKMPQIDQSVRHQLHTVVTLLFELKAQQKPFEFVLPGEGPLHAEP